MSNACTHIGCQAIGDGECHLDADGWMVNITREQHERVRRRIGCPMDGITMTFVESSDHGRDMVIALLDMLKDPKLSATHRKQIERQLERCRLVGIPREPWKEH